MLSRTRSAISAAVLKAFFLPLSVLAVQLTNVADASAYNFAPSAIAAYWDNASGTQYVIYVDNEDRLQYLSCNSSKCWGNGTVAQSGTYVPGSQLFAYKDSYNNGRLFFLTADSNGNNIDLTEMRGNPPGGTAYNLTASINSGYYPEGSVLYQQCYTSGGGGSVWNCIQANSDFAGFQDTASTATHHAFYYSSAGDVREMYSHTSDDSNWYDRDISGSISLGTGVTGLTALWDGAIEHVYYAKGDPSTELYETYHNSNGWWNNTLTQSLIPGTQMLAAFSPYEYYQWIWGAYDQYYNGSYQNYNGYLAELANVPGYGWGVSGEYYAQDEVNGCELSYAWIDSTSNTYFPAGDDGGCFYISNDSNNDVFMVSAGAGQKNLSSGQGQVGASGNRVRRALAGYYDGSNIHVFWVGGDGNIWEAYATATSLSNSSSGSWITHNIGGGGNAAH